MSFRLESWPLKKKVTKEPKFIFKKELYYFPKFIRRNINIILNTNDFKTAQGWYLEKSLEKFTANFFLTFKIFKKFKFIIPTTFFRFFLIFQKVKKLTLTKNEIAIFGPYSWNYAHQIHEFLVRIAYLNKKNFKTIYVPEYMRNLMMSKTHKKIFSSKKFKYFSKNKIIKFQNTHYLSHIENRFNNKLFKKNLNYIRDKAQKIKKNNSNNKYIFVSRQNSKRRSLLNEESLFIKLRELGFKKVLFENLSIDKQIDLASNCKIMVGYHGAGLSNCAYMPNKSMLIEISNKFYPHPHFELFCEVLKIKFKRIFCTKNLANLDGICNEEEVVEFIKREKGEKKLEDNVHNLDVGIDDYVTKPFNFLELLGKIKLLFKRSKNPEMQFKLNQFGWPKTNLKPIKPEVFYLNKMFFLSKLFRRNAFITLRLPSFDIVSKWYIDKPSEKFFLNKLLRFNFLKLNEFIFNFIVKIYFNFFKKKEIYLKKSDVILFGPFVNNHFHKISEFFLRIIFLKKSNYQRIFVPKNLKSIIKSTKVQNFVKKKILYYDSNQNYIFNTANYLSHIDIRTSNSAYRNSVKEFKKFFKLQNIKKNNKYKYILISRSGARKLLNEDMLFKALEPLGFKKISFEKYSITKQVEISKNAKIMIGYHGAGMANSFFMNKKNYLIEILNKHYNHPVFMQSAKIYKLKYKKFICKKNFLNLDGICDVGSILKYIKKIQ